MSQVSPSQDNTDRLIVGEAGIPRPRRSLRSSSALRPLGPAIRPLGHYMPQDGLGGRVGVVEVMQIQR